MTFSPRSSMDILDDFLDKIIIDRELFEKVAPDGYITPKDLLKKITASGLSLDDRRLTNTINKLSSLPQDQHINSVLLESLIRKNSGLIQRALNGDLAVSNWEDFSNGIREIVEEIRSVRGGENASYIPALREVDSNLLAVSVCTVDGQRLDIGDINHKTCIQSCSKAVTYLVAAAEKGMDYVHQYVGREPSGVAFNSLTLKKIQRKDGSTKYMPHNCMINAGAIMCCSIIRDNKNNNGQIDKISKIFARLCGENEVKISDHVYESELKSCDRNRCLAYMMREYNSFPQEDEDVEETLKLYLKSCSLEMTPRQAAVMTATLANRGVCPLTNDVVFKELDVRNCLSQMLSCGLYDYSGEWAFKIGLPAKSGVSGVIMIVIPNKMGIVVFSPRLDPMGNSVRGLAFSEKLGKRFSIHHLDSVRDKAEQIAQGGREETTKSRQHKQHISGLILASAVGDLDEIRRLISVGVDPFEPGVDGRTALHLAACENRVKVVNFLLEMAQQNNIGSDQLMVRDTFGSTALDDAVREGSHKAEKIISEYLQRIKKN